MGLNVGEPICDEGDYFGTPVIVAKRLCDEAAGGQILTSDLVREVVGSRGAFGFRPRGSLSLKGISEPLAACEVLWEPPRQRESAPAVVPGRGDDGVGRPRRRTRRTGRPLARRP